MAVNDGIVKLSVLLGFISFLMIIACTALPYWRVSDAVASEAFLQEVKLNEGLWTRCTSTLQQYYTCDWYDMALIGLPAYINGFRALMILAVIFSVIGFVLSIPGMSCVHAIDDESPTKRYIVLVSGCLYLIAGVLTGLCVSWYAAEVIREFHDPIKNELNPIKYTFGVCLYLGWIAAGVSLATGSLLFCCHIAANDDDDRGTYHYKPPVAANLQMNRSHPQQFSNAPIYKSRNSSRIQSFNTRNYDDDFNHTTARTTDGYV